jgi:antitoxin HigA-1
MKLKFLIIIEKDYFTMERLANIHPGEVLSEEFLKPLEITAYRLSKDTEIPQTRISQIIKGKRRITADTALRLSSYFGNSAKFWLGLQDDYDIEEEKGEKEAILLKIRKNAPLLERSMALSTLVFILPINITAYATNRPEQARPASIRYS